MKFICPHCNKETEDTVGGVLVDGFILECSECYETATIRFEAAQQSVQADVCQTCKTEFHPVGKVEKWEYCPICGTRR